MAQNGEIVGGVVHAGAGLILVHDDIETPVEAVFDGPMGTDNLGEAFGRHCGAEQVIGGFGGGFPVHFTASGDFADGRQTRPAMPFLQPGDIIADDGVTGFDAAVIGLEQRP